MKAEKEKVVADHRIELWIQGFSVIAKQTLPKKSCNFTILEDKGNICASLHELASQYVLA